MILLMRSVLTKCMYTVIVIYIVLVHYNTEPGYNNYLISLQLIPMIKLGYKDGKMCGFEGIVH